MIHIPRSRRRIRGLWLRPLRRRPIQKSHCNYPGAPPPDLPLCLHCHHLRCHIPTPRTSPTPPYVTWRPILSPHPSKHSCPSTISGTSLCTTHPTSLPPPHRHLRNPHYLGSRCVQISRCSRKMMGAEGSPRPCAAD